MLEPLQKVRPKLESLDDFAPTLSGGRCYERLIGREKLASIISTREDVLATRELPRIDNALLRASLPSSPDLDLNEAATGEVRPFAKTEYAPVVHAVEEPALAPDPRESETAERVHAPSAVVDEAPSFPIVVEIDEPPSSGAERVPTNVALARPEKNRVRRVLSLAATLIGLSAIVVGVYLALRSPEARVRFSGGASAAGAAVVRFARDARDVAIRGVRQIHANVELSS